MSRFLPLAALSLAVGLGHAAVEVDPDLPVYEPTSGVSGTIKSVGSDTMNNMMTLWLEGYRELYPAIEAEIEGKGSGTATPALVKGQAAFGPMSRKAKDKEVAQFKEAFGYKQTQLPTSIDMLAVYTHRDNPIEGLSLPQVDAIFSSTRNGGHEADITKWGQLGLGGAQGKLPISLYGRNSASGTYGYFKKHALFKGDYKQSVKQMPGSAAVINSVANDRKGIGYSGIGYKTADVRAVPLSEEGTEYVAPSPENVEDYPLARFLWLTVNKEPNKELDPLRREFIKYVFSQQGQSAVVRDGYLPVSAAVARDALAKVGIELD